MKRIVIRDSTLIPPFDEPARDLRILNKPLWLYQRDLLKRYCKGERELDSVEQIEKLPSSDEELVIHKDNLFFNAALIDAFIRQAQATQRACQIAFLATNDAQQQKGDKAIEAHALNLQAGIRRADNVAYIRDGQAGQGDVYLADLYYYPPGKREVPQALVIDTQPGEMGYYHIPSYMAKRNDLVYQIPIRAFLSIENWIHVFLANTPMGVFSWGRMRDESMNRGRLRNIRNWTKEDWQAIGPKIRFSLKAFWEKINPFEEAWRNHFLASREMVKVGKNCSIDPTAVIHGPTEIGDNVYIGPGTVIANSLIGNNVNIMQGCQIMLSVVSDRCFLPFNAGLFMTSLMENSMVAQNSTLQLCVVGRNTFIGANNCFTDFNLLGEPIKTPHQGKLEHVNMPVLGSAVGHDCKIGSGFIIYPGRMIGSGAVVIFNHEDNLLRKTVQGREPGQTPDDIIDERTGEPRRVVYYWPNAYNPDIHTVPAEAGDAACNGTGSAEASGPDQPTTLQIAPVNVSAAREHAN